MEKLLIGGEKLEEVNAFLLLEDNPLVNGILEIIDKYGGVVEINRKARENSQLESLMQRLEKMKSPFLKDLEWLVTQREKEAFISITEYRRKVLGKKAESMKFNEECAVTLEISACNFFPWLVEEAKKAIKQRGPYASPLHKSALHEGASGRWRHLGFRCSHANYRRLIRADFGHEGHYARPQRQTNKRSFRRS